MKKVAFIATSYITEYDGISVYTENILQELINKIKNKKFTLKLDIYVQAKSINLLRSRIKIPEETQQFARINFILVPGKSFPIRIINLTKILYKNRNYNIVYFVNPMPIMFASGKKIKTIHDLSFKVAPQYHSTFNNLYSEILLRLSIKFDNAIGYISETTKKDLEKFYDISKKNKKLIYLPNGIPFKVKNQKRPNLQEIEEKFKSKTLEILVVGRINRHKGFDRVLEFIKFADTILEKDKYFDSIQIHVVGKKTKETKEILKGYVSKNIRLKFWGYLSDEELNELYKNSQFCLFLSRNEGYGLPLIEALWLRTIPILSDIPIFKEIMGNDYIFFSDKTGYCENIYKFIKMVYENRNYRKNLMKKIDSVVEKEKDGYKIAAENLLNYINLIK